MCAVACNAYESNSAYCVYIYRLYRCGTILQQMHCFLYRYSSKPENRKKEVDGWFGLNGDRLERAEVSEAYILVL